MRIVLDTNVFISGLFFSGPPYQILKAWEDGKMQLVISPEILEEYRRVGETLAQQYSGIDINAILEMVTLQAEEETLRRVIREELPGYGKKAPGK